MVRVKAESAKVDHARRLSTVSPEYLSNGGREKKQQHQYKNKQ